MWKEGLESCMVFATKAKRSLKDIFLLFAVVVVYAGCGKMENDMPDIRLVRKIDYYRNYDGNSVTFERSEIFRYNNLNRIVEIVDEDGKRMNLIRYTKNTMVNEIAGWGDVMVYTLNYKGFISSFSFENDLIANFSYYNDYLQEIEFFIEHYDIYGEPISGSYFETYIWENGNLKTIEKENFLPAMEDIFSITTFEYSAIQNKASSLDFGLFDGSVVAYSGWLGKTSRYLPSKVSSYTGIVQIKNVNRIRYELDQYGYPVKIFVQHNNENENLRAVIEYYN